MTKISLKKKKLQMRKVKYLDLTVLSGLIYRLSFRYLHLKKNSFVRFRMSMLLKYAARLAKEKLIGLRDMLLSRARL